MAEKVEEDVYVAYLRGFSLGRSKAVVAAGDFVTPTSSQIGSVAFETTEHHVAFALGLGQGVNSNGPPERRSSVLEQIKKLNA